MEIRPHPVEHISPALHSNALEHSQHGKEDVVKVGDASIGSLPSSPTHGVVPHTESTVTSKSTWCWIIVHI